MVIAECPYCGMKFYGWSEEEVTEKYNRHCELEHENGHSSADFVKEGLKEVLDV